ncbi:hypothetical protein [Microbacterium sp. SORGH_AS_0862]|uniref:hypothetical protein n=1 Tax=Microbacterium sp. SORGH_AS_0862 TaxID=3041789 RepID=UPI00278CFCC0|nr:hypothetical protein [Microbacterium sp. SORGH_AS_0862]MDQ1206194.1 transposase [Microbacterium sp. SORGH_AS_0862]
MHDRRGIRADREAGVSIRGIARATGASRNAVRRALDPDARLDYERPSMAEEYTPAVRDVLADYPRISVNQVAEIIEWPGARRTLSDLVAQLRPAALEREREDLNRPALGTVRAGRIRFGPMIVGRMTVGSIRGIGEDGQLGSA